MHNQLVINEIKTIRFGLIWIFDHIVNYRVLITIAGQINDMNRDKLSLLSSSLNGGKLYTASQVLVDPGMQNPNWKSKLFTN